MSADDLGMSVDLGTGEPLLLEGWAALEHLAPDQLARQLQDQVDHASLYRQCFATGAGRYVLKDLLAMYTQQRIVRPGDDQFTVGIRQGQADVVFRCLQMIEFANTGGGKPTGGGIIRED